MQELVVRNATKQKNTDIGNTLTLQGVDQWTQQGKKLKPFSISKLVLLVFFQCKCLC